MSWTDLSDVTKQAVKEEDVKTTLIEDDEDEIVDIVLEEEDDDDDDGEETSDDEGQETSQEEDEDDSEEDEVESNPPRKNRAKQRIEALARKAKEAEEVALQERQEKEELIRRLEEAEERVASQQTSTQEASLAGLKVQKEQVRALLKQAKADEDLDSEMDLTDKLTELNAQIITLEAGIKSTPKKEPVEKELPKKKENRSASPVSEKAKKKAEAWLGDNDWLQNPENRTERKFQKQARVIMNELLDDGYALEDDDFYTELTEELKTYAKENKLEVDGYYTPTKTKKQKRGPTGGSGGSAPSKQKMRITKAEAEMCKQMGISPKEYALSKIRSEKANGLAVNIREL